MLGTEDDWSKLNTKRRALRTLLEPIEDDVDLSPEWWDLVERVFSNLLDTFQGKPDRKWWSHVKTYEKAYGSVVNSYLASASTEDGLQSF